MGKLDSTMLINEWIIEKAFKEVLLDLVKAGVGPNEVIRASYRVMSRYLQDISPLDIESGLLTVEEKEDVEEGN